MKTILELLNHSVEKLKTLDVLEPKMMCEEVLAEVLSISSSNLPLIYNQKLSEEQLKRFNNYFNQIKQNTPLAYIFNYCQFRDFRLKVDKHTLIPRMETELLIDLMIRELSKEKSLEGKVLVDMGTGSGAIAISLKQAFPQLRVRMVDVSEKALEIAKENAKACGVEIEALCGDLFEPLKGGKIDYFVSNPPYISKKDFETLDLSVKNFEPSLALLGGEDGLKFYRKFEEQLPSFLTPSGKAFFEIGYDQGKAVQKIFSDSKWIHHQIFPDYSGKDRFFFLEIQ